MPDEPLDLYRKLEPVSRVLRALGVPPPEAVLPTPAEIMEDLGVPTLDDIVPAIKTEIRSKIKTMR